MVKILRIWDAKDPNWQKYHDHLLEMFHELVRIDIDCTERTGFITNINADKVNLDPPKDGVIVCVFVDEVLAGIEILNFFFDNKLKYCGVDGIYIDPKFRHLGLGRKFIDEAKSQASIAKCDYLILQVVEGNSDAIKLYEKTGFNEHSRMMHCKL